MMKQLLPVARNENLIVKELPDETLVYDTASDMAHCLNETAAFVWKHCDGRRGPKEIAAEFEKQSGARVSADVVWLALDQLQQFNLLHDFSANPETSTVFSRRGMIRKIGLAAVAIPAITSIITPTAAQVASCTVPKANDCICATSAECASNCCRGGVCKPGGGSCG